MRGCMGLVIGAVGVLAACGLASGAIFTPGNVAMYRVGDGSAALSNLGSLVFIDEYTPAGVLVQSIAMPSTGTGAKLIASGTANSEGLLTISPDGRYLGLTGYNSTIPAAANLTSSASATVNRTVALIDVTSPTNTTSYTLLTDFATGGSPRAAVTSNGTDLWLSGSTGGTRYTTVGATTSTQINTVNNARQVNIFDGQLYMSNSSTAGGNTTALGAVGAGLPTTSGQTLTALPGIPAVAASSMYQFFFADVSSSVAGMDTLYIADDIGGALTKYSLVGSTWTANGTLGVNADDYRGITGTVLPNGDVQLFATRKGGSTGTGGGELVSILDNAGYNGAFAPTSTIIATAGTNIAYRGVAYIIPAPGAAALLGLYGLMAARRRRN